MELKLRKLANWSGAIIASIAVIYVAYMFKEYSNQIDFSRFTGNQWFAFGFLVTIYGAANFFLTFSWKSILAHLSVPISLKTAVQVFGVSQLAKYLPGNIFHLAGRQALGMAHGIPALVLIKSTIWELVLIALTGSLFGILILPVILNAFTTQLSIILFIIVLIFFGIGLYRSLGKNILFAHLYYLFFLIISGLIFLIVLDIITGGFQHNNLYIISAFIIAWLIGLVTPGAPAGVGVREMVLLILLNGNIAEEDILMAIIIGRLVTVLGDLLFYFYSIIFGKEGVRVQG